MHKHDCPTVLMLFHCYYPSILLEYPVVGDHHYLCILYKNITNTSGYFYDSGSEKVIGSVKIAFYMHKDDCPTVLMFFHCYYQSMMLKYPAVLDHHSFCVLCKKYC